ncbi:putative galactinol--sucrose galactosyltransferase 1 [Castanea sativa]|uniref:putative galactinol--sucrose galactosyltransferase 1 n=1 Tax=Castanea sativa TaxID=21020 RepID=UPI003F64B123
MRRACSESVDHMFLPFEFARELWCLVLSFLGVMWVMPRGLRFMCVFRFKMWWMTQRMGNCGQDIPFETQFLIVEARDGSNVEQGSKDGMDQSALYVAFLPILEGDFRAVLQGNEQNELEICLESGDPAVEDFEGSHFTFGFCGCWTRPL